MFKVLFPESRLDHYLSRVISGPPQWRVLNSSEFMFNTGNDVPGSFILPRYVFVKIAKTRKKKRASLQEVGVVSSRGLAVIIPISTFKLCFLLLLLHYCYHSYLQNGNI